jgi:hypothetical protein
VKRSHRPGRARLRNALALSAAALALALVCCQKGSDLPTPGTDFYAVAPESILEVSFTTRQARLHAFRWSPSDTFVVVTAKRPSNRPEVCAASPAFLHWVTSIAKLPIKTEKPSIDTSGGEWAELRIYDSSSLEAIEARIFLPSTRARPVVLSQVGRLYETTLDPVVARTAFSGCSP